MSASNRLTLLLVDISIYSDLPDQGEAGQTRTDRSNGDGGGDASMLATTPVRRRCRYKYILSFFQILEA